MGIWAERTQGKAAAGGPGEVVAGRSGGPTCVQINQEEQLGSETDFATQGSSVGEIKLQTSN